MLTFDKILQILNKHKINQKNFIRYLVKQTNIFKLLFLEYLKNILNVY